MACKDDVNQVIKQLREVQTELGYNYELIKKDPMNLNQVMVHIGLLSTITGDIINVLESMNKEPPESLFGDRKL